MAVGLALRSQRSQQAQGVYLQGGAHIAVVGAKAVVSPTKQLRGYEYNVGPYARKHPAMGTRTGTPLIPGVLGLSASRMGGLGLTVSLPIPGVPYLLGRMPVQIHVSNPRLARVCGKLIDGIEWVMGKGERVIRPVQRRVAPLIKPVRWLTRRIGRRLTRRRGTRRKKAAP
jgi:hypothetical protein